MKVLTLNLNGYVEANRYEKLETICEQIIEEDIDVICLQEVTQYYLEDVVYDDVKQGNLAYVMQLILKRLYGVDYELEVKMSSASSKDCYDEGIAILSKSQLIDAELYQISAFDTTEEVRYAISGVYKSDTDYYQVVCTHLNNPTIEPDYDLQVAKLLKGLNYNDNIIICADLNIKPNSEEFSNLIGKGLIDIVTVGSKQIGNLSTHLKYDTRIDYILTNFKEVSHAKALFTQELVSDHIGIMVEI